MASLSITPHEHPLLTRTRRARQDAPGVRRFGAALVLPLRAAAFLLRRPRLWPFALGPALVNAALFAGAAVLFFTHAEALLGLFWARPDVRLLLPFWYAAYALALALGLVLSYALIVLVGGVVASPFNDALSARAEAALTGRPPRTYEEPFVRGALRSAGSTVLITLAYGALLLPIVLLNLVPGAGSLAAALLGGALSAFFVALEYADVTFQRHGVPLRRKLRLLRGDLPLAGGFGAGVGALLWIPLLNVLCIPLAVVAGTALALALEGEEA